MKIRSRAKKIIPLFLAICLCLLWASPSANASTSVVKRYVRYAAHVQGIGWQQYVGDGELAGTTGQSRRLEAFIVNPGNAEPGVNITYQAYVQGIGWQPAVTNGKVAGTVGQRKRIQAVRMTISGGLALSIKYRVYLQNQGWTFWANTVYNTSISNAAILGNTRAPLRIEAIEVIV